MQLYEKDVRSADNLLKSKDASIRSMSKELKVLRHRVSLGSASTRSSLEGDETQKEESLSPPQQHSSPDSSDMSSDVVTKSEASSNSEDNAPVFPDNVQPFLNFEETSNVGVIEASNVEMPSDNVHYSAQQLRLRTALTSFYKEGQINTSAGPSQAEKQEAHLARLACKCAGSAETAASGDLTPLLWAGIANKYSVPPVIAVKWLARTLGPLTAVQFRKEQVPTDASSALDRVAFEVAAGNSLAHTLEVRAALEANDADLLAALVFRGCPEALRAEAWRALLHRRTRKVLRGEVLKAEPCRPVEKRRQDYHKLKARAALKVATCIDRHTTSGEESDAFLASAPQEVAADLKSAWSGEAFLSQPRVVESVTAIALTTAVRYGRYVRGSCEMATLLLFVMAGGQDLNINGDDATSNGAKWNDAEADAFWCLAELMIEMEGSIVDNDRQTKQAQHIQFLLQLYDPPLAELLRGAGIVALPTTRLGVALCSRAGLTLGGCARLWDAILADPKRFEFCNYTIVAVLLLSREHLLKQKHDAAALAEDVLAAPRRADMKTLLSIAYAICAFERRCTECPYPPRPGVLDAVTASALEAAQTHLSSAWGKVRAGGAGFLRVGRNVARALNDRRVAATAAAAQSTGPVSADTGDGAIGALWSTL